MNNFEIFILLIASIGLGIGIYLLYTVSVFLSRLMKIELDIRQITEAGKYNSTYKNFEANSAKKESFNKELSSQSGYDYAKTNYNYWRNENKLPDKCINLLLHMYIDRIQVQRTKRYKEGFLEFINEKEWSLK